MSNDTTDPQSLAPGGYISLVVHIWVDNDGKLIRGTIEDAHTGTRLAIDVSALAALLQESLKHGHMWNAPEEDGMSEERPGGIPGENPSDGGVGGHMGQ